MLDRCSVLRVRWQVRRQGDKEQQALYNNKIILDSSMVEHSAVNRVVVGSSPTRGAK